jgi:hypothetical protein
MIMSHCFRYELLQQYPDLVHAMIAESNYGEKPSAFFKDEIETNDVAVRFYTTFSSTDRMMDEVYEKKGDNKNAVARVQDAIALIEQFQKWINEDKDRRKHPIMRENGERMTLMKYILTLGKDLHEAYMLSTKAAQTAHCEKCAKGYLENIEKERQKQ